MIDTTPLPRQAPIRVLVLWNREVPEPSELEPAGEPTSEPTGQPDAGPDLPEDVRAVLAALREHGFEAVDINAEDDLDRIADAIVVERPDLVLDLVDGFYGDPGQRAAIAAYLDLLDVPYTGSDPLCLATCQDRIRTRLMLADASIPMPRFKTIRDLNAIPDIGELEPPLVVTHASDALATVADDDDETDELVHDFAALVERVSALAIEHDLPFLVEERLDRRRVHAIALGNRSIEVLPLVEVIETQPDGDAEPLAQWALAQVDYETADRIRELARRTFRVLGCRDLAQIDFHIDAQGRPLVVAVEPLVDLHPDGPFSMAAESTDRGFAGTVAEVVRLAYERTHAPQDEDADGSTDEGEPSAQRGPADAAPAADPA